MRASRFIGRVGGLAVALGAGAVVYAATPTAWADTSPSDATAHAPTVRAAQAPASDKSRVGRTAKGAVGAAARKAPPVAAARAERRQSAVPAAAAASRPDSVKPSPTAVAIAVASATASATGSATGSPFATTITVDPEVSWSDGLFLGSLNATSSRGLTLTYKVIRSPSLGGKIAWEPAPTGSTVRPDQFSYLPYLTTLTDATQNERFSVLVSEVTPFDTALKRIPVVGLLVDPVLDLLHRLPLVSTLLAPLIGSAQMVTLTENPYALAAGRPAAFTYKMPSFDGTLISLNYFPAATVANGQVESAGTVLNGPDLGFPGNTDVFSAWDPSLVNMVPGLSVLRTGDNPFPGGYSSGVGYNVITWDPRGEWASGGVMQLDNPNYEGRDVSSIITWATSAGNPAQNQIATTESGDPFIGMVGGSYGGGIQLTVAGTPDKRIDAIVPSIAWNTLNQSLYPNNTFKTAIGSELLLALIATGARINKQIYLGIGTGSFLGFLSQTSQALLTNAGPGILTNNIAVPTLLQQGTPDILFELNAAMANGQMISTANPDVPVKTMWFCGGHGVCLLTQTEQAGQGRVNMSDTLKWLDQYVAGNGSPAETIPVFQWFDQAGNYHSSGLAPYAPGFNNETPLTYQGRGGTLALVPLLGGSGPSKAAVPPDKVTTFSAAFALASGSKAWNALNVKVTPPVGTEIAGAPTLSFSYQGLGSSRAVYAQLVDNATGFVVGNIVTPVPITLDGRTHTVQIPMGDIAYTVGSASDSMTLQITSSALPYANFTAWGLVNIGNVNLNLPTVALG